MRTQGEGGGGGWEQHGCVFRAFLFFALAGKGKAEASTMNNSNNLM